MAFGSFHSKQSLQPQPVAEINMIPLIDVMLVLLIIFMITAPLLSHSLPIHLPKETTQTLKTQEDTVTISLDNKGQIFWNNKLIQQEALESYLNKTASHSLNTAIHIRADGDLAYKKVIHVMAVSAQAGLSNIGFVTDPSTAKTRRSR